MRISRRTWLSVPGGLAWLAAVGRSERFSVPSSRILRIVQAYEKQGFHRTGTHVDRISGDWLCDEVRRAGLQPARETFTLDRVDPVSASLIAGGRRVDGLPLFDGAFTDAAGVRGRLSLLDGDGEIGLTETVPNGAGAGPLGDARRKGRHKAIVCTTQGGRPGLCPSNADFFLHPFGPPVLQLSSEHATWLRESARQRVEVQLVAHVDRTPSKAFNVTATIAGADRTLPPLVVMTPRSGWYSCASERGGGIVCWLELMGVMRRIRPARDILFVASSGHELGHLGINAFVDRRPGIVSRSVAWMHFGANIGAAMEAGNASQPSRTELESLPPAANVARGKGNTLQASDDKMESLLERAMASTGLTIDRRNPRGTIPGGEAEVVHRGGGRYVSAIGRNVLFHNPEDRGPEAVDAPTIAAFIDAFAIVAKTLSAWQPYRGI